MKYIKESVTNYGVGIFTIDEAEELYCKYLNKYGWNYNLRDKIHYFHGFERSNFNDNYNKTCRFIIAYNDKDILGVCHVAYWASSAHYAISYCSTNNDYFSMGISKRLLEELFKYFSETYPNEILHFSGYSVEGWKFLRKYILEYSKKYNVKIKEQGVEYPGLNTTKEEYADFLRKSRKEIEDTYGKD